MRTRSTVLVLALAASGLLAMSSSSFAVDGNSGGAFINGGIGQANVDKGAYNDNDTGYNVNIGYRWAFSPNVALGVEGGYMDLGSFSPKVAYSGFPKAKFDGWTAGVNGHFNINPQWYFSGRAGMFRADVKGALATTTTPVYVDSTSTQYYAGVGFGYDFSNNLSLGLNYDHYRVKKSGFSMSPDLVSVNAEYRF